MIGGRDLVGLSKSFRLMWISALSARVPKDSKRKEDWLLGGAYLAGDDLTAW